MNVAARSLSVNFFGGPPERESNQLVIVLDYLSDGATYLLRVQMVGQNHERRKYGGDWK